MSTTNFSPGARAVLGGELPVDVRLPTPPGVARRFWARHPWLTDACLAGLYLLLPGFVLLIGVLQGNRSVAEVIQQGSFLLIIAVALVFRRRVPLIVLGVVVAALFVAGPGAGLADILAPLLALYAVAVYRGAGSAWIGFGASALVAFLAAAVRPGDPAETWLAVGLQYAVTMLAATLIGVNVGNRKRYVGALLDLTAQLAEERDRQAKLARIAERARIAREMHDVIAHSLSVMVVLADGSSAIAVADPARAQSAMREVAATGRASLAEMRRLLGVLTEPAPGVTPVATDAPPDTGQPLRPQPGTEQLADLVETFRGAGLPTRLQMEGRSPDNPGLQLAVYRIVQESLTNALRYAAGSTLVTVRVRMDSDRVEVVVADNSDSPLIAPSHGSGRGLIGMQERVALYGGTLDAGPRPHYGWQVRATLTIESSIDPGESP